MKMQDVDDSEVVVSKKKTKISDDEVIQKSIQAMHNKASVNQPQDLSQLINNGGMQDMQTSNYWEIKNLPSLNKLYPDGTRILGRPLKVLEVKKLSSLGDGNAEFIINDILRKTIKGINVDNILIADKLFLVMWLRSNSFKDSSYRVDFHCDKCEKDSDFHFDVDSDLEVQHLSNEYDPDKSLRLSTGQTIKIKFLTIEDSNKVERFKEVNKGSFMEIDSEILTIAAMISEIDGEEVSLLRKYEFVIGSSPQDFSYIVSYIEKFGMGLKPYMNVKCTKCGGISQMAITFHQSFFLPSYKFE